MPAVKSRGKGRRTISEINMVPFIDVMLVLLIIFMVTAPLITPSQIDLPSIGKASSQPQQYVQVIVSKDESIAVQTHNAQGGAASSPESASLKTLAIAISRAQGSVSDSPVVISADKTIPYETVVKVMDTLQKAGVQRIGLSVQLAN